MNKSFAIQQGRIQTRAYYQICRVHRSNLRPPRKVEGGFFARTTQCRKMSPDSAVLNNKSRLKKWYSGTASTILLPPLKPSSAEQSNENTRKQWNSLMTPLLIGPIS